MFSRGVQNLSKSANILSERCLDLAVKRNSIILVTARSSLQTEKFLLLFFSWVDYTNLLFLSLCSSKPWQPFSQ